MARIKGVAARDGGLRVRLAYLFTRRYIARLAGRQPDRMLEPLQMPGSEADADDAVRESWLRLSRSGTSGVHNLRARLTTVVAQQCLWTCFAPAPLRC